MKIRRFAAFFVLVWLFAAYLPAQQILTDTVHSRILKRPVPITVMVPKGLETGSNHAVFYLLHSWGGDHRMFLAKECELRNRYSDLPFLIVTPSADTCWYVNTKGLEQGRYRDFMEKELFPYVDARYKCEPSSQGIGGWSMGGYGALVVGLKNPGRFKFVANLSGAINVPFEGIPVTPYMEPVMKSVEDVFGDGNSQVSKSNDVVRLAQKLKPAKRPYVFVTVGSLDEYDFLLTANRDYAKLLENLGYESSYAEPEFGHFTYDILNVSMDKIIEGMGRVSEASRGD